VRHLITNERSVCGLITEKKGDSQLGHNQRFQETTETEVLRAAVVFKIKPAADLRRGYGNNPEAIFLL
jgi:hypothetical protein